MPFDPEEAVYLRELERDLRKVEDWPLDSPLAFVIHLAPRTIGSLGERLISKIAEKVGVVCRRSRSPEFDTVVQRPSGDTKIEVKFSTEDPPRFQQVRDPRREGRMKYDALVCISGRPEDLVYWVLGAVDVAALIDTGAIKVQHQDSTSRWFLPSRSAPDRYAAYRKNFQQLKDWLTT